MRNLLTIGLALALPLVGCSLSQNYNECNESADCGKDTDGSSLFCTDDHLCVRGTPAADLCKEIYPANSPPNAIVVGALVNVMGGNDKQPLEAFKLGIDQVNMRRSPDPPLALHVCEVSATAADSYKSMEVLARQRNAVAVVGPTSSSKMFLIKDEVIRSGVPVMSPSATSPEISSLGTADGPVNGLFYRVAPADTLQGPVLARQLPVGFSGKLALIFVNDPYGSGLKDAFLAAAPKQPDVTVNYNEPAGSPDITSTQSAVNQVLAAKPDYVVAITNLYSDTVLKALVPLQTTPTVSKIIMADGAKNANTLALANSSSTTAPFTYTLAQMNTHLGRVSGTAPTVDVGGSAYNAFTNDFKVAWNGEDPGSSIYTAYAYDSLYAVAIAIGAAGANVTPAAVSAMLGHINKYDPTTQKCIIDGGNANQILVGQSNYLAAKNKVAAGAGLVLQGASGTICFNPHGDRVSGLYESWTINTTAPAKFVSTPTM